MWGGGVGWHWYIKIPSLSEKSELTKTLPAGVSLSFKHGTLVMPLQLVARCFPVHVVVWSPQCPNTLTIKGFGSPLPFPTYERLVVQATTAVVGATFDSGCPNVPCRLQEDPPAGVSGAPTDNNIMIWNAVIFG